MSDFGDGFDEGVDLGDATGFISSALRQGQSVSSALADFREAGGAIRTADWYQVAGLVRASMGRSPDIASLSPESTPTADLFSVWRDAPEGLNVYQVDVHVYDPLVGMMTRPYSVMTRDNLTVDEAVSQAVGDYGANASKYMQQVYGGVLTGLYRGE